MAGNSNQAVVQRAALGWAGTILLGLIGAAAAAGLAASLNLWRNDALKDQRLQAQDAALGAALQRLGTLEHWKSDMDLRLEQCRYRLDGVEKETAGVARTINDQLIPALRGRR